LSTPRHSWNTAKVGIKHQSINQSIKYFGITTYPNTIDHWNQCTSLSDFLHTSNYKSTAILLARIIELWLNWKTVIVVWGVISRLEQVVFGSEYDNVSFAQEKHAWLFIVLDHWNNSLQKDVVSFWHIILILSQPVFVPYSLILCA
jgi:hypothetical protein